MGPYAGLVRRALVIGNGDDFDTGFVGHRFRQHGFTLSELHREHHAEWRDGESIDDVELVLTLGSEWNVYRTETAEPVDAEAELVRRIVDRRIPLFAICFGAQVLSHALGGCVERSPSPEIGWLDIELDEPVVASGPWMEWHDDTFTVPEGFTELARTASGPQLIVGDRTLGTQFHPEVTETMIDRWLRSGGAEQLRDRGGDPDELRAATRSNVAVSRPNADDLVDWFLGKIA